MAQAIPEAGGKHITALHASRSIRRSGLEADVRCSAVCLRMSYNQTATNALDVISPPEVIWSPLPQF